MTIHVQPMPEVTRRATDVLVREIGVVDTIRFLNQFRAGTGNHTEERKQLFAGMSTIADIKSRRSEQGREGPMRYEAAVL